MWDDEDDYMSDKFLASQTDVRPSLIKDRAKMRQVEVTTKQKEHIKRQRIERLERTGANRNERLQESLQRPIEQDNKGFQLLAKMGYKPGEALGKAVAGGSTSRITEPIGINIKSDRGGLGRDAALRDLTEKRKQLREQYLQRMRKDTETITAEEYRRRVTAKAEERFLAGVLRKCHGTCENLDRSVAKIEEPTINWFWPQRVNYEEEENTNQKDDDTTATLNSSDEDSDEEEIEYSISDKLELLMSYMRTSYNYCMWCGIHYIDVEDMQTNCPGLKRDDH